jgi:hypothetical protein
MNTQDVHSQSTNNIYNDINEEICSTRARIYCLKQKKKLNESQQQYLSELEQTLKVGTVD